MDNKLDYLTIRAQLKKHEEAGQLRTVSIRFKVACLLLRWGAPSDAIFSKTKSVIFVAFQICRFAARCCR